MSASREERAKNDTSARFLRRPTLSWRLLPIVAALLLAVACRGRQAPIAGGTPVAPATPNATIAPKINSTPISPGTPVPPPVKTTLTIWGPDFMAPSQDVPGGDILAAQIKAFEGAHPGCQVRYVRKKPYGQGGLVHFLRSTHAVAPELLPDLVLLDMSEVGLLADADLLQPLEPLLSKETISDLLPFARQAGQAGEHLMAIQYETDVRFLAYNPAIIKTPPATWSEVLASGSTYLLPIGGTEGAVRDSFLPQYLALGGKLEDRNGQPFLDKTVVTAILEIYRTAHEAKLLPAVGADLKDASDCWPVYLTTGAAMTNVSSWDYGREQANKPGAIGVGPLPTLSGAQTTMSTGWGWALLSKDASRRELATALLDSLMQPKEMAAWSQKTYHLPTRRSALSQAIDDPAYLRFLQRLLEMAVPQPREPIYGLATEALRGAIEAVIRGELSPQEAAARAVERMRAGEQQPTPSAQP